MNVVDKLLLHWLTSAKMSTEPTFPKEWERLETCLSVGEMTLRLVDLDSLRCIVPDSEAMVVFPVLVVWDLIEEESVRISIIGMIHADIVF